jgi:XTP/dITP diphosphohydrolase
MSTVGPPQHVVLATNNAKKLAELRRIVAEAAPGIRVLGLSDVDPYPEPAETELTFEGNALLKAEACVRATGLPALADDSGLAVDVLGGSPGVFSARWSGRHGDDRANLDLLLAQIGDVPDEYRQAHFACAAAFARPDGQEHVVHGRLPGSLIRIPRGTNGFGYDPILVPDGDTRTCAELSADEKNAISHRGRAFRALTAELPDLL